MASNKADAADFVENVMSPSVHNVSQVPKQSDKNSNTCNGRKRNLSSEYDDDCESSKKLKGSSANDESNVEIVNLMKFELSSFKSSLKADMAETIETKLNVFESRIKDAILSVVKEEIKAVRDEFNTRIEGLSNKLEQKLLKVVKTDLDAKLNDVKTQVLSDDKFTKLREDVDTATASYASVASRPATNSIENNICIRNLKVDQAEKNDSNITVNKVYSLIRDGLKEKNIKVVKAVRKESRDNKPGVIIATIESLDQKIKLLKNKKSLRKTNTYQNVYIESDKSFETRVNENNMRTLLKEIGRSDQFMLSNGRLCKKKPNGPGNQ